MGTKVQRRNTIYGYPNPQAGLQQEPLIMQRAPLTTDTAELGTIWVDKTAQDFYILTDDTGGINIWATLSGPGSGTVTSISEGTGITLTPNPITTTGTVALTIPVTIANGGTNAITMATTDGTVYFDGTRLVTTATGSSGQVLTSAGVGVAPSYQNAAGGGGDVSGPGSSTDRSIATWNGAAGTDLFDNPTTEITSAGVFTNTGQPAFLVNLSSSPTNVTGDGTAYFVPFDTVLYDQGSNFNTGTSQYIIPVDGVYLFNVALFCNTITAQTLVAMNLVTNDGGTDSYNLCYQLPVSANGGQMSVRGTAMAFMVAGETVEVQFVMDGSTKTVGIYLNENLTYFSGVKMC